jgi:hypothetical protein
MEFDSWGVNVALWAVDHLLGPSEARMAVSK